MKNRLPLILSLLFVALIAFGIIGVCQSRISGGYATDTTDGLAKAEINNPDSLLDVRTPDGTASQIKDYVGFRVSFNKDNGTPNWVAWELLGSETDGTASRYDKFWQDFDLEGCPATSDYSRSGYDRGHLCPAADQKWSDESMKDCFSLANIAPQDHALNTGAWKTLENKERQWARRDSAIYIVAGPIYESTDNQRIGQAGVRVPGAFFKILVAPYLPTPRGIAFVYPNMTAPGNMENYVMTIRDVEKLTGFDFFHALPDDIEEAVETSSSFREWNHKN